MSGRYGALGRPLTDAEDQYLIQALIRLRDAADEQESEAVTAEVLAWLDSLINPERTRST